MSFDEDRARDRAREAANAGYLTDYVAACERFEQADRAWAEASREYRAAYNRVADRNPVLDDDGLPLAGQVAPLGSRDTALLASCERAESEAWARRQAAAKALEQANDFTHPW